MSIVIGIHLGHDASIALIKDGRLVSTSAIERWSGYKKDMYVRREHLDLILQGWNINIEDIDAFTFSTWNQEFIPWLKIYFYKKGKYPLTSFGTWQPQTALTNHLPDTDKIEVTEYGYTLPDTIQRLSDHWHSHDINDNNFIMLNVRIEGIDKNFEGCLVDHHMAHASSVFYTSNLEKAAIFTADASMHHESACSSYYLAQGNTIHKIKNPGYMYGNFYDVATELCGIGPGTLKAGSLMGLAAYGNIQRIAYESWEEFTKPQGLRQDKEEHRYIDWLFHQLSGRYPFPLKIRDEVSKEVPGSEHYNRSWQEPYTREESTTQEVMDIAASVQFMAERSLVKYSQELYVESNGASDGNLCLAGGIFLNCNANYKIANETDFDNVVLYPACGDDGTAAGSALWFVHNLLGYTRNMDYTTKELAYTGVVWNDQEFEKKSKKLDLLDLAMSLLEGKIVCWYQGRSENGPRALGNRSFLASPLEADMKDILNERVKFREWYRPFAPIVLEEKANEWFNMDFPSPYMLHTVPCKQPFKIPAAVHIDNTARVQTINRDHNEKLYDLLKKFDELSGVPVLINTSLNVKGNPIVEQPVDAYDLFIKSDVDILVINDRVWKK
jgi:carbamoyltransferase